MLIPPGIWYWCIARFLLVPILDCGIAASSQLDSQYIAHLKLTPLPDVHRSERYGRTLNYSFGLTSAASSCLLKLELCRSATWSSTQGTHLSHVEKKQCTALCLFFLPCMLQTWGWQGNVRRGIAKMRGKNACVWEVIGDSSSVRATYANTTWQLCMSRHLHWHLGPQLLTACCHSDLA